MASRNYQVRVGFALLLLLLLGCSSEGFGHERKPTATPRAPYETPTPTPEVPPTVVPVAAIPPEIEQFAAEWPMPNKDYQNTRTTMDAQINRGNVAQLGVAWTLALHGGSK